jgi:hypothetical protein
MSESSLFGLLEQVSSSEAAVVFRRFAREHF